MGESRFLMCPPTHYDVDYVINPWMEGNVHRSAKAVAAAQWQQLQGVLAGHARVELMEPQPGLPDLVFTANAGVVVDDRVVLARFFHPERQGEEPWFQSWFESQGYSVTLLPADLPFEGAGDALLDRSGGWLWAGYGFRSELAAHPLLAQALAVEVLSLRLMDERFYHLDTCFCPLSDGTLLYYPPAFDFYSNRLIETRVPAAKRLVVGEADALAFACNAVNVGRSVILNQASAGLRQQLQTRGYDVVETPLSEFLKAGGAAKCLTLRLDEPRLVTATATGAATGAATAAAGLQTGTGLGLQGQAQSSLSRTIRLQGHLLDSGLINRTLDRIVEGGGSFQVLDFALGQQRHSTSSAAIRVSAPDGEVMADLMARLIALGALATADGECDAALAEVLQDGVAPDDFYVSTIYPTEVRLAGRWHRVMRQRMVGALVLRPDVPESAALARVECRLLRDLRAGEQVVVGVEGLRILRPQPAREGREARQADFSFMAAGVSSERRVELVVEQMAWEWRRIRDRGGKVVVVAGPVVIHTGGGAHLAQLVREGYVQALLGGNAIAVHDVEQALMGTSLGVDLQQGLAVHGGHRHHLKAINTIRRCGSLAAAVEQGVLNQGIFHACVQRGVPFVLAGSIRDDGPLPDTEMDLIRAQAAYAQALEGAEMVLMLSSMLHSIGVGNMTPAGVKLVCVDINPAVVTKLSDRGSLESVGVVTDVGLFLSLLVRQLDRLNQAWQEAEVGTPQAA
jgi:lysine-ketoglutarate reductase/saccharopine dehydrogenase-like protein (TIGR00300 family)